jgi:hypothetical protein
MLKHGKMEGHVPGIRYCKGICSALADYPPIGNQPGAGVANVDQVMVYG